MSFFEELKRRNVVRVGIAYVLLGWVVMQAADFALDLIDAPNWIIQVFFIAGLAGLPIALFFAWAFEITPEGIKREEDVDRTASIAPATGRKLDKAIIAFLGVAVVLLLADRFFLTERGQAPGPESTAEAPAAASPSSPEASVLTAKSVAVLAFDNMSPDPANEYFADGISEEILNVLSGLDDLRVIARTSAFSFKDSGATVAEIADKLDVGYVLEGSVRRAGDRVRVTAQLIETDTESHLWSDTFDRELDDIFAVQDEIARAIANELQLQLSPAQEANLVVAQTENIEAYNRYLQGRQLWHQRGDGPLRRSMELLQEAVELDPDFARAWAALADSYLMLMEYSFDPQERFIDSARDAANRALELEPGMPQALTTRAYLRFAYDFDWDNAERDFLRAMEADPSYPTAQQWYGEYLAVRYRDIDGALAQFRKGAELDPLAPIMWHVGGWITTQAGRVEEGMGYYEKALGIDPGFIPSLGNLSRLYLEQGNYDESLATLQRVLALAGRESGGRAEQLIAALQDPTRKPELLERMVSDPNWATGANGKARDYMLLDEPVLALDELERALAGNDPYAVHANRMVIYDPLRDDPRFQAHLAKMNLWPPEQRP